MRAEEFDFLFRLEEQFWWFVGMRQITDAALRNQLNAQVLRILDAGCGTGYNLSHFSSNGRHDVFGLDLSADAIDWVRKRGFQKVCQASVAEIPFASDSFDLVCSFDVLCQIPNPLVESSLREIHRVLKPGGSVFIRVPAIRWMHSSHDEAVGSFQRFSMPQITSEIAKAGLKVQWSSYANCFLFPVAVVRRALKSVGIAKGSDVRPLPIALRWMDPVFRGALQVEAAVFRRGGRLPIGLSAICLAEKPSD